MALAATGLGAGGRQCASVGSAAAAAARPGGLGAAATIPGVSATATPASLYPIPSLLTELVRREVTR